MCIVMGMDRTLRGPKAHVKDYLKDTAMRLRGGPGGKMRA